MDVKKNSLELMNFARTPIFKKGKRKEEEKGVERQYLPFEEGIIESLLEPRRVKLSETACISRKLLTRKGGKIPGVDDLSLPRATARRCFSSFCVSATGHGWGTKTF